jgi:hypothetical protein
MLVVIAFHAPLTNIIQRRATSMVPPMGGTLTAIFGIKIRRPAGAGQTVYRVLIFFI